MNKKMEEIQNKVEELVNLMETLENDEEKMLASLNAIINIGESASANMFEFLGLLEEAKFIYRHECVEHDDEEGYEDNHN